MSTINTKRKPPTEKKKKPGSSKLLFIPLILIVVILGAFSLFKFISETNKPIVNFSPVLGIDVSNHQGEIDWDKVKEDDCTFAFIKATEGDSFVDSFFKDNWKQAHDVGIKRGAYVFFSMKTTGKKQADLFIKTVPKDKDALPPVIDLELDVNLHSKGAVQKELDVLIEKLEDHYGVKPILYINYTNYYAYIYEEYLDYPIWISDITTTTGPTLDRDWVFWQYTHTGTINGVKGDVDRNQYIGDYQEFVDQFGR